MSSAPSYASLSSVMAALDFRSSAYKADVLERIIAASSRRIDDWMRRHFFPLTEARTFKSPATYAPSTAASSGFFLDDDLISVSAITRDATALTVSEIELWPASGPPYSWLGTTGATIVVTGVWGFSNDTKTVGTLSATITDGVLSLNVSDSSKVGAGDVIYIDSEAMIVEAVTWLDTADDLASDLTAVESDNIVAVSSGAGFTAGETILLDAERMLIVDIAGNNLTVQRAWDGTTLATHSASDVYAPRSLTVERGSTGTTAAAHTIAAAVTKNAPPAQIVDLCIAETLNTYGQEAAGYNRVIGSGDNITEARGLGILDIRRQAARYRRSRAGTI